MKLCCFVFYCYCNIEMTFFSFSALTILDYCCNAIVKNQFIYFLLIERFHYCIVTWYGSFMCFWKSFLLLFDWVKQQSFLFYFVWRQVDDIIWRSRKIYWKWIYWVLREVGRNCFHHIWCVTTVNWICWSV